MWLPHEIVEAVAQGLIDQARHDDEAQEVYGFDTLAELKLHPLIRRGLLKGGYGAWAEVRYPDMWTLKSKARGTRCDLVLTPQGQPIGDPDVTNTLFAQAVNSVPPEAAYWLEIKTVAQFETGGPFKRYSQELLNPVPKDIAKLWNAGQIRHAGLMLVLFTQDQATAEHDINAWTDRCIRRGFPVTMPVMRGFAITDRIGNGWCTVALAPVRG